MKRIFLLIGFLTMSSFVILAKQIDENTAKQVGQTFLLYSTKMLRTSVNLDLTYKSGLNSNNFTAIAQPITFFYVFNNGINGFIIVAGDDNVEPILGYSDEGTFDPNNIPHSVQKWLDEYENQIRYVIENEISATQEIKHKWTSFIKGSTSFVANTTQGVNPLIATKWNQSPYYNELCPGGSVTGCAATAMAQIMKYWNYPKTGSGFHSYNHEKYGTLSANFGGTTYQWNSMPNKVTSPNNAVATLNYHCGVSVDMDYSPQSSGAYVISAYTNNEHCVEYALKTYFGYKNTLQGLLRDSFTETKWINLLKKELDAGRPVLYVGYGSGGGHAFVADGYDNNNYFHFNWGWGGAYDGYFQINALNPSGTGTGGGTGGYNSIQHALIGIQPPSGGTSQTYNLQLYSDIIMPSTEIWFTDPFSLTVNIENTGNGSFSGQYCAAIFDHEYNFLDFMEIKKNMTLNPNSHYTTPLKFSNTSSTALVPGIYYVGIYFKTDTTNWTIIAGNNYTNLKVFEIYYYSEIETYSNFTISTNNGKLIQSKPATINVDVVNTGNTTFYGQFRISLSYLDRTFGQSLQILNEYDGLPSDYHYTNGIDFTGDITVEPGTYLLEIAYKEDGSSYWYYAGSTSYSNPIYVIVEAAPLPPDVYELNNAVSSASTLPITFSGNTVNKNTIGSNIHNATDNDFYKINLPAGYNYSITARIHDAFNSGTGIPYTVDVLFSYSKDNGTTWSETYDDIMTNDFPIQNGGKVYFHVAPYFAGETGTYRLDITINRSTVGIDEFTEKSGLIKVTPNPVSDFVNIDLNEFSEKVNSIKVINEQGQQITSVKVTNEKILKLPLNGLSDGVYFIQIISTQGILTKKIILNQ